MHVLVVDDTADITELFRLSFARAGHQIETAADAFEALRIIAHKANTLDVIILDYHMPTLSGVGALEQLQQVRKLASIPVILFTGDRSGQVEARAHELGVARVVYKPITPPQLIAIAQQVVDASSGSLEGTD